MSVMSVDEAISEVQAVFARVTAQRLSDLELTMIDQGRTGDEIDDALGWARQILNDCMANELCGLRLWLEKDCGVDKRTFLNVNLST
jgi:chloramphenicol 3-O-phosphotransferase